MKMRSKLNPKSKKMVFTGFVEGSKSIRYFDAPTRQIKISRNVAFIENDEPLELEIITDLPGLLEEGEPEAERNSINPKSTPIPVIETPPPPIPKRVEVIEPVLCEVCKNRKQIDYRKLNDPWARSNQLPSDKIGDSEKSFITRNDTMIEIADHDQVNIERLPQTIEEALGSDESEDLMKANNGR
jgi:hypothetical protein